MRAMGHECKGAREEFEGEGGGRAPPPSLVTPPKGTRTPAHTHIPWSTLEDPVSS